MPKVANRPIKLEHVERLSRGKASGINIGSRQVGHHLYAFERDIYQRALKAGYVLIDSKARDNIRNIWQKACVAKQQPLIIVIHNTLQATAQVWLDGQLHFSGDLAAAKQLAKQLAQASRLNTMQQDKLQ